MEQIKQKRRGLHLKRRFLLLNLAAVVLLLFSVNYIMQDADDYQMRIPLRERNRTVTAVEESYENPDVVRMTSFTVTDRRELMVSLHAVNRGRTAAYFRIVFDNGAVSTNYTTGFTVSIMRTIVEKNDFMINFTGFKFVLYLFLGYLVLALGVMLYSFIECVKKAAYSYRMIAYGGIVLFLSVLLTILCLMLLNYTIDSFTQLVMLIAETGEWFLFVMLPPMAVSAIAISVSNIRLMQREGASPVNTLGILASAVWLISMIVVVWLNGFQISLYDDYENGQVLRNILLTVEHVVIYIVAYLESMLISTAVCAFLASRHRPPQDRDYIIILGCSLRRDGALTPLLRGRVDSAIAFEEEQYRAQGRHACFVPSGGQGSDEIISEAEAMETYLLSRGIAPEQILREDQSVNTYQNMQFSKEVIDRHDPNADQKKFAFATTSYHVFRGYILSKKNGFDAQGISAKTKWYFFPNAFLREFAGLLYDQKLRHLAVILCFILAAIAYRLAL